MGTRLLFVNLRDFYRPRECTELSTQAHHRVRLVESVLSGLRRNGPALSISGRISGRLLRGEPLTVSKLRRRAFDLALSVNSRQEFLKKYFCLISE
jgi:hypothetical protein